MRENSDVAVIEQVLVYVGELREKQSAVLITKKGMCVAFDYSALTMLKKNAAGVIGMKIEKGDALVHVAVCDEDGSFVYDEREYKLAKIGAGKRGTYGKPL